MVKNWQGCEASCPDETNTRVLSTLTLGASVWRYFEVFGAVHFSWNHNDRQHLGPTTEPAVQTVLGDFCIGLKAFGPVVASGVLYAGAGLSVRAHTGLGDIAHVPEATTVAVVGLVSIDLRRLRSPYPVRIHLNVGYVHDESHRVLGPTEQDYTPSATAPSSEPRHAFWVQQFALSLNRSRMRFGIGLELPLPQWGGLLTPMVDIQIDAYTVSPNHVMLMWPELTSTSLADLTAQDHNALIAIGLRLRPIAGLWVDMGVEIRLSQNSTLYGPVPPFGNVFLHVGYIYERRPSLPLGTPDSHLGG